MAYTAKTWVDNSAPSVCAANLNDLETGVADAHTTADRAVGKGVLQAKGDLFGALSASSPTRVVVGADDTVLVADSAQTHGLKWVQIGNAQVLAAAAIAYSKLNLAGSIVNADVGAGAAIAYSKLALAGSIVNADIASSASISAPKIAGFPSDSAKFLRGDATWAAPASSPSSPFALISDIALSVSAASIDFQNIPATYAHLRLVASLRFSAAVVSQSVYVRFNNDSTAVYNYAYNAGGNAGNATGGQVGQTSGFVGNAVGANGTANRFDILEIVILDYTSTNVDKQWTGSAIDAPNDTQNNQYAYTLGGAWRPGTPAAITRVTLLPASGNFVQYSRATLYGLGV